MSTNADRKRVAVIGAGLIGQAMHLPHLALLRDRFELAVVADPSRTVRERVGDRFGIPVRVASAAEAIAHPGLDAVVIAAPNSTHARTVLDALAAGLHVLVEKPLCITLEDVDAIVEARDRAGTVVQVAYNNRFDLAYEKLVSELPGSTDVAALRQRPRARPRVRAVLRAGGPRPRRRRPARPDRAGPRRRGRAGAPRGRKRRSGSGDGVLGRVPRQPRPPGEHGARDAREDG